MRLIKLFAVAAIVLGSAPGPLIAKDKPVQTPSVAVGPQYDSTHVYVAPADLDTFTSSLVSTFGGTKSQPATFSVTPTLSETTFVFVFTPVGTFSVFGFKTPVPYPFGVERTGYLVTDMDSAVRSAKAHDADIVVLHSPIRSAGMSSSLGRAVSICSSTGTQRRLITRSFKPFPKTGSMCPLSARTHSSETLWPSQAAGSLPMTGMHQASRSGGRTIPIGVCASRL